MRGGQNEFSFPLGRGGKRKGAGRKPKHEKAEVPHRKRQWSKKRHPLLVTMKLCSDLHSLRSVDEAKVVIEAIERGNQRDDFRIVHVTIQSDHLHLIVEADEKVALSKSMTGLAVRLARGLNRLWGRKGRVFKDRYHSRVLDGPKKVRYAMLYVFQNATKHKVKRVGAVDRLSSALTFFWSGTLAASSIARSR